MGERAIESHLLAPCCWMQTLDMHESPLADSLRPEIRERLRRGEPSAAIEARLVARYGDRIRAGPENHDTRTSVVVGVGVAMLAAVLALAYAVRRWTRSSASTTQVAAPTSSGERDDYDARLDEELRVLEES